MLVAINDIAGTDVPEDVIDKDVGFVFVAQEKTAPYAVRVYICSDDFLEEGYNLFREAIGIYHECKVNNHYWGYEGPNNDISELLGEGEEA